MGRSSRAYKSEKRSKELKRLKKREDKIKRRLAKKSEDSDGSEDVLQADEDTDESEVI